LQNTEKIWRWEEIKYHIICPHCGNILEEERAISIGRDKNKFCFICGNCKKQFNLLKDKELQRFVASIEQTMRLIVLWICIVLFKIMYRKYSEILIPILFIVCFSGYIVIVYLIHGILQHFHNNFCTTWSPKKDKKATTFGMATPIKVVNGILYIALILFIATGEAM